MPGGLAGSAFQPFQLAFVPHDIDRALAFWTGSIGAGPFFHLPHVALEDVRHRGVPTAPDFSLWLGYWGDTQIELIRQHNDAPSIYLGAADDRRIHHLCVLAEDVGAAVRALGPVETLQTGLVPGGGEVAYVQPGQGPIIEILKPAPGTEQLFGMMRAAHAGWNGADPVRSL